jgi:ribonuclease HI
MTKYFEKLYLVSDGGCRGNPGQGAIGFIILDERNRVLARVGKRIGYTTNNRAEYSALIEGFGRAAKYTKGTVHCFLDSELVVKQVKQEWRIKDGELEKLFYQVLDNESAFKKVTYTHVPRTHRAIREVDKIVDQALDGNDSKNSRNK